MIESRFLFVFPEFESLWDGVGAVGAVKGEQSSPCLLSLFNKSNVIEHEIRTIIWTIQ